MLSRLFNRQSGQKEGRDPREGMSYAGWYDVKDVDGACVAGGDLFTSMWSKLR